jgi:putative phosphoesterase
MRVALLSDIHANFPALCRALQRVERLGADMIVVAGDLVGRGPHPVEALRLLEGRGIRAIRGNIEHRLLELHEARKDLEKLFKKKKSRLAWTALQLTDTEWGYLQGLPEELELELGGVKMLVVHGSPLSDTDYIYPSITSRGLRPKLMGREPDILVCAHSHIPFTKRVGKVRLINCGSVGLSIDGDPRGSFALCDVRGPEEVRARIVRFAYPVEEVISDIEEREAPGIGRKDFSPDP